MILFMRILNGLQLFLFNMNLMFKNFNLEGERLKHTEG